MLGQRGRASMWQAGGVYTMCGVMLEDHINQGRGQTDLFAAPDPRAAAFLSAMDEPNRQFERETCVW